ncbi:MAG TPA: putative Ig domain-containing protein [Polyangiaceae bacterium]|nr:putative Ig domain-containing protein [Polyangiaceae bacterium]
MKSRRRIGYWGALGLAAALPIGGCFSPDLQLAECVSCPEGVCPGDLQCVANHCVYPGRATVCEATGGTAGELGRGGAAGDVAHGGSGAGRTNTGGTPNSGAGGEGTAIGGAGGSGPGGDGGADDLTISEPTTPSVLCSGRSASVALEVAGGQPPYRWSLVGGEPSFTLSTEGAEATLEGSPDQAGDWNLVVTVRDQGGHSAEWQWHASVRETPVVRTAEVPSVCPNELYSVSLEADGVEPALLTWSSNLPAQTGLSLVEDRIEGHFEGAAAGATHIDFAVTAEADGCVSEPATLSLVLESATATACPGIAVDGVPFGPPRRPCLGNEYQTRVVVQRGKAPYHWQATAEPEGLSFDAQEQTLSGVASAEGDFTVQVEDGTGRTVQVSYPLKPSKNCWFSYVSTETTPAHLELLDPILLHRRSYPAVPDDAAVTDFRFSPDGQFLAYRRGQVGAQRVAIIRLETGQEQLFDFPSVIQYDWSPNSAVLAVAFDENGARSLGAIDVARAGELAAEDAVGTVLFSELTPTPAQVDSELTWFAPGDVGFLSVFVGSMQELYRAPLESDGFASPRKILGDLYPVGTPMRTTLAGLYAVPQGKPMAFYGADGSAIVLHDGVIIGGTGRYLGRAQSGALAVFRATDSTLNAAAKPRVSGSGCDDLLAWAGARERIACTFQAAAGNQVVIFDLDAKSEELSKPEAVRGTYEYPRGAQVQRRRAFSPNGERFAFTTDDALHVATLDDGTPRTEFDVALSPATVAPNNAFGELEFSPDGNLLLMHRGKRLSFFDVRAQKLGEVVLSGLLAPSLRCEEDFRDTNGGWCGAERPLAPFAWSQGSDLAAFETAKGTLEIRDFTWLARDVFDAVDVHPNCSSACVSNNQFGFQP